MVLNARQVRRFYRLFDLLVIYAARKLDMVGCLVRNDGSLNDDGVLEVARALWEMDENRQIVASYVSENPDGLNRSDLREVEQWQEALYADFGIVREGGATYFLYGDHAFAVRGLQNEVDVVAGGLPAYVSTAIMPFDGLITYCTCMLSMQVELSPAIGDSMLRELAEDRDADCVVSTSRQFMVSIHEAREANLRMEAEEFAHQTELEMNAHELGHGQHEGVLTGLSWDEREQAIHEHIKADPTMDVRDLAKERLDSWCTSGRPVHTLAAAIGKLDKAQLLEAARRFGVRGVSAKTGKQRLAREVAAAAPRGVDEFLGTAVLEGERGVRDLKQVYDEGGHMQVAVADVQSVRDLPAPYFPTTMLFKADGLYTWVMVDEAMEDFAELDWDAELARARAIDRACAYVDLMVDFRGVMPLAEAVLQCLTDLSPAPAPDELLVALQMRMVSETVCFDQVNVDGDAYLVHHMIAGYDPDEVDEDYVNDILDAHEDKEPRPVRDLLDECEDVADWVLARPAARELTTYLDAHVPDVRDDYYFADRLVEDLLFCNRDLIDIREVMDVLEENDLVPTEAQLNHLMGLLTNFVNDIPKWPNNGWTANELRAQR